MTIDAVTVGVNNVGAARAAGVAALITTEAATDQDRLWLATTDADSTVPTDWLARLLDYARAGADVVAGTITVADWAGRPVSVALLAEQEYASPDTVGFVSAQTRAHQHRHVHGANLAFTARAYRDAGGFPSLCVHEDVALMNAFLAANVPITWASDIPVVTSARRAARAPAGFAAYLDDLQSAALEPTL